MLQQIEVRRMAEAAGMDPDVLDAAEEGLWARVVRYAAEQRVDYGNLTLTASFDRLADGIAYRLVRDVAQLPNIRFIEVPATWWDALKFAEAERSPIMRWWLKDHPVRWQQIRVDLILPHMPLPADYLEHPVFYLSADGQPIARAVQ